MFIGVIYKITGSCGKVYIGSTVDCKRREINHIYGCRSNSRLLLKPLTFEVIDTREYKLKKTLLLVEQFFIDTIDNVNGQRAYTNTKIRREIKREKNRKHYLNNIENYRERRRTSKARQRENKRRRERTECIYCKSILTIGAIPRHTRTNKKCLEIQKSLNN